jgi:serine/threonine-protein kinase
MRIARFRREFGSVLTLEHPNVVRPEQFLVWPDPLVGHPCIIMPHVEGERLTAHCRKATPTLRVILTELLRPIADALDYIHRKGICHRDIKPTNIMVRRDGVPLVMDFGIARSRAAGTLTRTEVLTTFEYGAPEYLAYIASQDRAYEIPFDYQPEADLFCLGATFCEVLTGHLPYEHVAGVSDPLTYLSEKFQSALRRFEPRPPSFYNALVPKELDELFLRLMAREPEDRLASGAEVVRAVDELLAKIPAHHALLDAPFAPPPRVRPSGEPSSEASDQPRVPSAEAPVVSGAAVVRSSGSGEFRAPTPRARAAFKSPVAAQSPGAPPSSSDDAMPQAMREAQARLRDSAPRSGLSRRVVVGSLLIAAVAVILGLAAMGNGRPSPGPSSRSLLDEKAPVTAPAAALAASPAPATNLESALEIGDAGELASAPGEVVAVVEPQLEPNQGGNSKAINSLLDRDYGGARSAAGPPTAPRTRTTAKVAWIQGDMMEEIEAPTGERPLGIPIGTEIAARLTKPLDSRTISSGPAVARLTRPLVVRGAPILPTGVMLYGRASATGAGRFDIQFTRLRFPDGREVAFEGIAYDTDDKKPGLRATQRIQTATESETGLGEKLARGTASSLLNKVGGDDVGDLAKTSGQAVLNHADTQRGAGATNETLLLDAPADLCVFVSGSI